jgi:methylthioribose-1-phosphate isomerase
MALTSIRTNGDSIEIIDQLLLPHSEVWIKIESPEDAYEAIKKMKIRGAPAIASLAALSVASYLSRASKANPVPEYLGSLSLLQSHLSVILSHLYSSRPTAVNLGAAVKRLNNILKVAVEENWSVDDTVQGLISEARAVADEDVGRNKTMSRLGADWILRQAEEKGVDLTNGVNVLTVCNTGSLATSVSLGASRSSHERRPVPFPPIY